MDILSGLQGVFRGNIDAQGTRANNQQATNVFKDYLTGQSGTPGEQSWMQAFPAATLLGGLPGALIGSIIASQRMGGQEADKSEALVDQRMSDLAGLFSRSQRSFADDPQVQAVLEQLRSGLQNTLRTQGLSAVRSGSTAESANAARGSAQSAYSDAVKNLFSFNTNRRDQLNRENNYRMDRLFDQKRGIYDQKADNWQMVAQNLMNIPTSMLNAGAQFAPMLVGL